MTAASRTSDSLVIVIEEARDTFRAQCAKTNVECTDAHGAALHNAITPIVFLLEEALDTLRAVETARRTNKEAFDLADGFNKALHVTLRSTDEMRARAELDLEAAHRLVDALRGAHAAAVFERDAYKMIDKRFVAMLEACAVVERSRPAVRELTASELEAEAALRRLLYP